MLTVPSSVLKLVLALTVLLPASASLALAQNARTSWELVVCAAGDDLPFSSERQLGFENRIMSLLAEDLHAKLTYLWLPELQIEKQNLLLLYEGKCDAFLAVSDVSAGFLTTLPYYQTTYYFVYRSDAPFEISSFDDAVVETLRIGAVIASPPDVALGARGLVNNIHHYYQDLSASASQMIDDVVSKKIDVAVIFGPLVREQEGLTLVPVAPQVEPYALSMVFQTVIGVRQADTDLRDLLNQALAHQWDEIQAVLQEFNIPVLPLPKPVTSIGD